ncbi:MAG: hypothetical protein ABW321_28660 [Polyangiales bacterium]
MKGCLLFAVSFLLGVGLFVGGMLYETAVFQNIEARSRPARIVEVAGIVLSFSTIFAAFGYHLYRRLKYPGDDYKPPPPPPPPTPLR